MYYGYKRLDIDLLALTEEEKQRALELFHQGLGMGTAISIVNKERKLMIEKRVICGKARSCEVIGNKIQNVYDKEVELYVPYDDFTEKYDKNGNLKKKKQEKKEEKKEERREETQVRIEQPKAIVEQPKIIEQPKIVEQPKVIVEQPKFLVDINTKEMRGKNAKTKEIPDFTYSANVTVDDSKVDSDRVKITNRKKSDVDDIIDEYISLLYH